jgi:hypothetical protein
MTIREPMTFATDLALGALTAFFATRLVQRAALVHSTPMKLWAAAFAASASAAIAGGCRHGLVEMMSPREALLLWIATMLFVGLTSFFLLASAALAALPRAAARIVVAVAAVKLAAYAVWVLDHHEFRWVIYDYASAMIAVAALQIPRLRRPASGARWILLGIGVSFAAAAVQYLRLAPHPHFNHNDLYHVIQMAATALLYRGGRDLAERS